MNKKTRSNFKIIFRHSSWVRLIDIQISCLLDRSLGKKAYLNQITVSIQQHIYLDKINHQSETI